MGFLKQLTQDLNSSEFGQTNLTFANNSIGISGTTFSVFVLNSLIDKLKNNPNVLSISIDDLTSLDQGIEFKLTTQLKQGDSSL